MNLFLENKVAIITGSTQGIGEAIAVAFAAEGAHTVITGRNQERASLKAQEITEKFGVESLGIGVDLATSSNGTGRRGLSCCEGGEPHRVGGEPHRAVPTGAICAVIVIL